MTTEYVRDKEQTDKIRHMKRPCGIKNKCNQRGDGNHRAEKAKAVCRKWIPQIC